MGSVSRLGCEKNRNASIPPEQMTLFIGVGTQVAHSRHHHHHRLPSRFHHPRQTETKTPRQRNPNLREMTVHALRLAYSPRTLPHPQFLAMAQCPSSLAVATQGAPVKRD